MENEYVPRPEVNTLTRSFSLFDDSFMTMFFNANHKATEFILNIFLERKDILVKEVNVQKKEKSPIKDGRDVVLDIFAVDSKGKHYNVEVQRADSGANRKRARFHSSVIDSRMLKAGEDFTKMNDSYVIFITEHDVMGKGKAMYHVERTIRELDHEDFNDGNHIIYVNGECRDDSEVGLLMRDFAATTAEEMHYDILRETMHYFKDTEEGRLAMCEKVEKYGDEREKNGRIEGRLEGKAEGKSETQIDNAKKMIASGKLSLEDIALYSGLPLSEVEKLAN